MGQSESNDASKQFVPKRTFGTEFFVGLFTLAALACAAWMAVGLGGIDFWSQDQYTIQARFDNISGLENGASVEIAGVKVGDVTNISFDDPEAVVTMRLNKGVQIRADDIALIRTKGIIGDRYVKIARGADEEFIENGGTIIDTESVVDLEDVIGKVIHSFTGDDKEEKSEDSESTEDKE